MKMVNLRGEVLIPVAIFLLGLGASGWVAYEQYRSEAREHEQNARHRAERSAEAVADAVDAFGEKVVALAAFLHAAPNIDREQFAQVVRRIMARYETASAPTNKDPAVGFALSYAPKVSLEAREAFQQAARAGGIQDFAIFEQGPNGKTTALDRLFYFPVYFIEPYVGNEGAVGFDLYSNLVRRQAIDRALKEGRMQSTGRISLVQGAGSQYGVLLLAPLSIAPKGKTMADGSGFASGVLRVSQLVGTVVSAREDTVFLLDRSAPAGEQLLHPRLADESTALASLGSVARRPLQVGGRDWEVLVALTPFEPALGKYLGVLLLGLIGFGGMAIFINRSARDRGELESQGRLLVERMNDLVTKTTVLDKAPFAVAIADPNQPDKPIVYVNESFTRITGYSPREILGRNCRLLQGPGTDPAAVEAIRDTLREGGYIDIDLLNYRRDGSPFHNRLQLFTCFNAAGELVSHVGVTADITDLKQAQAEREQMAGELQESLKLQSLGLAVAGVAHDLNTPIGVALTASTYLGKTAQQITQGPEGEAGGGEAAQRLAGSIERTAALISSNLQKAADLVRSFRLATVQTSRVELRKVALQPFFESLLRSLSPLMQRANCNVTVDCPPNVEIDTDQSALSQAITNLLVNASIHAFEGRENRVVRITVQDQGENVQVAVADNGNGMAEEALSKAFTPFFTTRRNAGGSGLGLFSTRRVVEQVLGGSITLRSIAGQGTTFTIALPRRPKSS